MRGAHGRERKREAEERKQREGEREREKSVGTYVLGSTGRVYARTDAAYSHSENETSSVYLTILFSYNRTVRPRARARAYVSVILLMTF